MDEAPALIRPEELADREAVRRVNELAFGRPNEADLVDAVRSSAPHISLVAVVNAEIAGHILFSPVEILDDPSSARCAGLGPMAVLPSQQNRGIGSDLVRMVLEACRARGYQAVVVLGHPRYYPRFGFVPASDHGLSCEWDVPNDVFLVLELTPGTLGKLGGLVRYLPAFAAV